MVLLKGIVNSLLLLLFVLKTISTFSNSEPILSESEEVNGKAIPQDLLINILDIVYEMGLLEKSTLQLLTSSIDTIAAKDNQLGLMSYEDQKKWLFWKIIEIEKALNLNKQEPSLDIEDEFEDSPSTFSQMYNKITLLNVIYFTGALLIIGSMTFFITLGFETYGGNGLGFIATGYGIIMGIFGIITWNTLEYDLVGGLLCSCSVSMTPIAVYGFEKAAGLWVDRAPGSFQSFNIYIKSEWVIMEIATLLVGLIYLLGFGVKFPFLLAFVSFAMFYLSMDLAPLLHKLKILDNWSPEDVQQHSSAIVGLGMLIMARLMEREWGTEPDMAFWPYLFGLTSFSYVFARYWVPYTENLHEYKALLYYIMGFSCMLIGTYLNRTTFHVFGVLSTYHYLILIITNPHHKSKILPTIHRICTIVLLLYSYRFQDELTFWEAIISLLFLNIMIYKNFNSELLLLFHLTTSLGFMAVANRFDFNVSLIIHSAQFIPAKYALAAVSALGVLVYNVGLIPILPKISNLTILEVTIIITRTCIALILPMLIYSMDVPIFSWTGASGLLGVAILFLSKLEYNSNQLIALYLISISFLYSNFLSSEIIYLAACVASYYLVLYNFSRNLTIATAIAIFLIILAIPLSSKLLIVLGFIVCFAKLTQLAYDIFKDTMLFPLLLTVLGIVFLYAGIIYQSHMDSITDAYWNYMPTPVLYLLSKRVTDLGDIRGFGFIREMHQLEVSPLTYLLNYPWAIILWPSCLIHFLNSPYSPSLPSISFFLLIVMSMMVFISWKSESYRKRALKASLKEYYASYAAGTNGHGIIITVKGKKDFDLHGIKKIAVDMEGEHFWNSISTIYPAGVVTIARSAFLPFVLTPYLVNADHFIKGHNTFSTQIEIGTGKGGTMKAKHTTIENALKKLGACEVNVVVLYSYGFFYPYCELFTIKVKCSTLLNKLQVREGYATEN